MAKQEKIPQLRFPSYTDAWEQQKLGEVAEFFKGKGYSKADLVESGEPIILYGRLYTDYKLVIDEIDTFISDNSGALLSNGGEVIVPSSGESPEDIAVASVVEKSGVTLGGDLNIITLNGEVVPIFLALAISNGNQKRELSKRAQGKSIVHLHNTDLKSIYFNFPTSSEQACIGNFFRQLDDLLTLHQRKLEETKALKKSLLQKMFPKNGEKIPEFRLPGFEGEWEEKELEDVYQNISKAFVGTATPYYVEAGHFYLESNNIKDGQINYNNKVFINDEFYEKQKDKWLQTGDMVMVQSGHVGHTAVIPEELNNTAAHALIMFRKPKFDIEPYFLNFQYQTHKLRKKIDTITTGNTIRHILASDMKKFVVDITSYDEQIAIGNFFKRLDDLIMLHDKKLRDLRLLKKALLQQMFV